MHQHILVLVDGSDASRRGLDEAIAMAKAFGATLRVVRVLDPLRHVSGFETGRFLCEALLPRLRAAARAVLRDAEARAAAAGVAVETLLREDMGADIAQAAVDLAPAWAADLIVLGTHGRRGIDRFALGSDAEDVARHADVPVLLVRSPARPDAGAQTPAAPH